LNQNYAVEMEIASADGARQRSQPEGRAPARSHSRDGFKPSLKGVPEGFSTDT